MTLKRMSKSVEFFFLKVNNLLVSTFYLKILKASFDPRSSSLRKFSADFFLYVYNLYIEFPVNMFA